MELRTIERLVELERGGLQAADAVVDLSSLVRDVADRLRPLGEDHRLRTDVEDDLEVEADRVLLERVVENLMTNAFTHTPPGTNVEVRASEVDGYARVAVIDDGPGVQERERTHLGERFFRGGTCTCVRPAVSVSGLAMSAEILGLHGSRLEIDSAPGQGSAFAFRLPLLDPVAVQPVGAERQPGSPAP